MIPVKIVDVRRREILADSGLPAVAVHVVLYDEVGQRAIIIWAGEEEGLMILRGLLKQDTPRPMTQAFITRLLQAAHATVESVAVSTLKDYIYYATVRIRADHQVSEIDARPTDALALALQLDVPIYVSTEVMTLAGQAVAQGKAPTGQGATDYLAYLESRDQRWAEHRAKQRAAESDAEHAAKLTQDIQIILSETFGEGTRGQ
jgi:bifunctional DNase/RNase